MNISSSVSGTASMKMGESRSSRAVTSSVRPRIISVLSRPGPALCSTSSSGGTDAPSGRTSCSLVMFSCSSESTRSRSILPRSMMPTRSQTSSSSRRLCEEMSTVVPYSATSCMMSAQTWRRMTGSSPSTGSSRISSSGRIEMASQKAACLSMPREKRRIGCFTSRSNTSRSCSKRFSSKPG